MRNPWVRLIVVLILVGGVGIFIAKGQWFMAIGYAALAMIAAMWLFPFRSRNTVSHQEVAAMSDEDPRRDVVIYWRPGCPFCMRLRARLGKKADDATWINIWEDQDAAEFVRSVNDGNETVPTVVLDGESFTNPDPSQVLEHLEQH